MTQVPLFARPVRTVYLSGAVSPALMPHASRPDLGVLVQPATDSYRRLLDVFGDWAADNGCFAQGERFDPDAWISWVATLPTSGCRFVVAPDVVGDAAATWRRSEPWLGRIRELGFPAALVAQDGLEALRVPWSSLDSLFIGGSTEWKLSRHAVELCHEARRRGKWVHVGRVNSARRFAWAAEIAEADSADGTFIAFGPTVNVPRLLSWLDEGVAA